MLDSPWKISDADIEAVLYQPSPLEEMRAQRMNMIMAKLTEGIPVTLTVGDRRICTYYPDGRIENHDFAFG